MLNSGHAQWWRKDVFAADKSADNVHSEDEREEIYENTSFELNSVEKDAIFNGNPNAKTEETLSSVPQQQTDIKVLDSESESAKPEMESAKIINDSGLDHELKNEETEEVDMNESKFMERRAELASVPEASIEEEDQIKGCENSKNENAVEQSSEDSDVESLGSDDDPNS